MVELLGKNTDIYNICEYTGKINRVTGVRVIRFMFIVVRVTGVRVRVTEVRVTDVRVTRLESLRSGSLRSMVKGSQKAVFSPAYSRTLYTGNS